VIDDRRRISNITLERDRRNLTQGELLRCIEALDERQEGIMKAVMTRQEAEEIKKNSEKDTKEPYIILKHHAMDIFKIPSVKEYKSNPKEFSGYILDE
jgi:hypothetical protein